jgi:outer membrane protein OmpA-like peptidoglycan-associated protein
MKGKLCLGIALCVLALVLTGCLHGRGEHSVPVSRDYGNLANVSPEEAENVVDQAHRVGAHHFAPYDYESAKAYLDQSYEERRDGDRKGGKDFASLAESFGEAAIANGSGIPDQGEMAMPATKDEAMAIYNDLEARYRALDACKAKVVAPNVYAAVETSLSRAEHELMECNHYPEAIRILRHVGPDIDAILAKDVDGDGITDMEDGEPWHAEDHDGFQDEDGIPEPKPYPQLAPVLFDSGSSMVKPFYKGYLKGVANMMDSGYLEADVHLGGHTDNAGSEESNVVLSEKRATAVAGELGAEGVAPERVHSQHFGESQPIADNGTAAGRAQNRRVELMLDSPDVESPYCK